MKITCFLEQRMDIIPSYQFKSCHCKKPCFLFFYPHQSFQVQEVSNAGSLIVENLCYTQITTDS